MNKVRKENKRMDVIHKYLGDMLGVSNHTLKAVQRQFGDDRFARHKEAHDLIIRISEVMRRQIKELEQRLSALGGMESSIKKAATSTISMIARMYDATRSEDPASKGLRDDHTALNLTALSYTMLYTTALSAKDTATAELSLKHLFELTPLLHELTRIIPQVVAVELASRDTAFDATVAQAAMVSTQKAWSYEVRV